MRPDTTGDPFSDRQTAREIDAKSSTDFLHQVAQLPYQIPHLATWFELVNGCTTVLGRGLIGAGRAEPRRITMHAALVSSATSGAQKIVA